MNLKGISNKNGMNTNGNVTIYSPLIRVQDEKNVDKVQGSINSRLLTISFSYMFQKDSDQFSLVVKSERLDVRKTLANLTTTETIVKSGSGPSFSASQQQEQEPFGVNNCDAETFTWRRVERLPIFSCVDFRFEFVFEHGVSNSSQALMGLDNVEVNYENSKFLVGKTRYL